MLLLYFQDTFISFGLLCFQHFKLWTFLVFVSPTVWENIQPERLNGTGFFYFQDTFVSFETLCFTNFRL